MAEGGVLRVASLAAASLAEDTPTSEALRNAMAVVKKGALRTRATATRDAYMLWTTTEQQ